MPKQFEDGGIIKGKSHAQGGVPFVVKGSGQQIEVEGREAVISSKAFSDDKIHTYRGTNWDILNQINQKYGGNSLYEKVESIGVGDFVICISSVEDPTVREYTGTNEQVISAINESGGCVSMTKGAKVKEILDGRRSNKMAQGGAIDRKHDETYEKWRHLVNMSASELERFYNSDEGKKAGLTASEAKKQGIGSGRQSARWILRMKKTPKSEWTEEMWRWAGRQVNFISRMSGMKGDLYDDKGRKTRKHLSLLIWGHDPKKKMGGGSMMHLGGDVQNELRIKISNIKDSSKKYTGKYKDIFDIIEEDIVLYNPYGTTEEELIGTDFFITITPKPDNSKIEKIRLLKDVTILSSDSVMHLGGDMSKHLAPNGKPSNLTHEQWHLVRTPEFKAWFGDWENDPANASKVVDENGEPLVVYHGTKKIFTEFREKKYLGSQWDALNFFTTNYSTAVGDYDGWITYPCFIKIINPVEGLNGPPERSIGLEIIAGRKTDGFIFSGFVLQKPATDRETWVAVPKSNQIKLADQPIIKATIKNKKFIEKANATFDNRNATFDGSNPDIRYKDGGLIAPNGESSNLTHEQWHLVRTPEFKAWFGDWENYDYQKNKQLKGSVVIDFKDYNNPSYKFTNEPIVVYHGTDSEFSAFDLDKTDAREKGWFGKGFYFSSNEEMAKGYGKNVKPYFLKLSNPFQFWGHQKDFADSFGVDYHKDYERYSETIREKLIELGYDGVIAHSVWGLEYVAFYPEQIKLADGTNTTFDGSNPDIRYAKGGLVAPNGKPSNLTAEQYKLVRTPQFKAWFGDWENDPNNASKVLDENGEPLVVYHGTNKKINVFDKNLEGLKTNRVRNLSNKSIYFTSNRNVAETYGKKVYSVFLDLRNPSIIFGNGQHQSKIKDKQGENVIIYDIVDYYNAGVPTEIWSKFENTEEFDKFYTSNVYAVGNPKYIKLADGTNTTFDGGNPDIRYAKGGSIGEIYRHKHIPTMTLEITGFTNNGVKGIQKDSSGNRLERTKGKAVTYSNDLLFDLFTLEYPLPQRDDFSMYARGGRTISQTPAPVKDRVYGSKTNRPDSAASGSSGSSIVLNDKTVSSISSIIAPYNKKHPNKKITMSVAKSVVRRGMGAYSSSHRPTISGGAANSRVAWGLARLKAFVYKAQNGHSKSGKYSQDNDLLNELGIKHSKFEDGGEILMGGKADGMTLADIAKEHGVSIKTVIEAYRDGMKHEMEHTTDHQVASEIAKDHIVERIDYYDMLDKAEKTYASGGIVKYFDKDNEDRLARPSGSIEKELLQKVNYDSSNFVGNFGWKTSDGSLADAYLLKLDEYDRDLVKDIKLKDGERIFRYLSRTSAIGGMTPMIKINLDKGLLYFLDVNDEDIIDFQTRGLKAEWVGVIPHKFEDGGKINWSEYYESGGHVGNPPSEFLDDQGNRKIDPATIAKLTKFVNALPQTKSFYFDETTGKYTPERRKIHIEIINSYKKGLVCIENANPIAILMGGSPASGKSSFLKKYSPYLLKDEIFKIDADDIRSKLPEYQGWNAAQTHLETKDIVNTIISDRNIGIPCNFDLIYDGTMNNVKSYGPLIKLLKDRGYKVFIVYMDNVDKDVVTERALSRYKKSGRFVPLEVIDDFFAKGKGAFESLKQQVDGYMVVDGSNQDYNIIEQGGLKLPKNRKYGMLGRKIQPSEIPQEYASGGKINYSEALSNFEKAYGVDFLEVQREFDKRLKQYQSMTYDDAFDGAVVALRLEKYLPDIYKDFIALWFSQTLPSKVPPQKNVWGKLDLGYLEDSREIAIMPASVKPISKYNTLYNDMGEAAFEEKAKIVAYCVDYDKKTVRPWSNGYYVSSGSDGYIAASNGSILMTISILNDGSASFNKYLGEKAGKVFDVKTGVKINDTFPPIERVIPNEQTNPLTILVSTRDLLSQVRAIDRANKFMQSRAKILVCIELMNKKYFYQSNLLLRVLEAFYDLGIERIRLNLSEEAHKALWIRKFDNTKQGFQLAQALVMPFAVKDDVAWYSIVYSDNVSVAGSTSQQPIQEQEQTTASAIQQTEKEVTPENQLFDKGDLTFLGVLVASFGVFKQAGIVTFTKTMTSGDPLKVTLTPFYDEETDSVNYIIETEPNRNYVLPTPKGTLNSLLQFPSGFKVSARDAYRIYLNEKRIIFDNLSNRAKNGFLSGKQNLLDV